MRSSACGKFVLRVSCLTAAAMLCVAYLSPMHDWDEIRIQERLGLLQKTIGAVEKALDHLFVVGGNINVDGIFGVRLLEDQLLAFLKQMEIRGTSLVQERSLNPLVQRLSALQKKAKKFRQEFSTKAKANQPEYYQRTKYLLDAGSWGLWYPSRDVNRQLVPTYDFETIVREAISEDSSDECLQEPYRNQCQFTEECWTMMTAPLYHGYSLTHEILFILNAIALGCDQEVELATQKWMKIKTKDLLARECASVLHETELIASRDYPIYRQDLFMEQAAICGILGFRDFFRDEWLFKILEWQSKGGCYYFNSTAFHEEFQRDFPNEAHFRHKREERPLSGGCMSHVTAVAVAALGQYIRFLLEPLLEE